MICLPLSVVISRPELVGTLGDCHGSLGLGRTDSVVTFSASRLAWVMRALKKTDPAAAMNAITIAAMVAAEGFRAFGNRVDKPASNLGGSFPMSAGSGGATKAELR